MGNLDELKRMAKKFHPQADELIEMTLGDCQGCKQKESKLKELEGFVNNEINKIYDDPKVKFLTDYTSGIIETVEKIKKILEDE